MIQTLYFFRHFLLITLILTSCNNNNKPPATAQIQPVDKISLEPGNPYAGVDKSPMDMSYYPANFPSEKMNGNAAENTLIARVIYSRPKKNGREIFADTTTDKNYIQLYGKEWRLGANEATEIEFFKPAIIQGNKIMPGRYILYCIPYREKWIIKLNSNLFSWGLHMNTKKDIMEVSIPVILTSNDIEHFTIIFQKTDNGADLLMAWGNIQASLPISFN